MTVHFGLLLFYIVVLVVRDAASRVFATTETATNDDDC